MFDVGQWQTPTQWLPQPLHLVVGEMDACARAKPDRFSQPSSSR